MSTKTFVAKIETPKDQEVLKITKTEGKEKELVPLEDRLQKLNQLFKLQSDYLKLQESLTTLSEFMMQSGERPCLELSDGSRRSFTTYNHFIFQEVVNFLKSKIQERIKSIEPQLNW